MPYCYADLLWTQKTTQDMVLMFFFSTESATLHYALGSKLDWSKPKYLQYLDLELLVLVELHADIHGLERS